ncbi:hypothetical protein LSUE1_G007444 [Lachnellula suecica]|uniref:Uncharacterized protein n=1 Tax=Lachnellula suecica TaxID=602035 RepID=A0A8T9BWF3_9HELO|nr:hypothetical protein LSUE1_G007444 [Lachnellula suecica]
MAGYSFSIVTYDRGGRWNDPTKKKPYHGAFLETSTGSGVGYAFQLRGMPGAFYFSGEESVDLARSGSKNGQLEVGTVPVAKYDLFKQLLGAVPIDNDESSGWNSLQVDWLRAEGFVSEDYPNNVIQYWLREDR